MDPIKQLLSIVSKSMSGADAVSAQSLIHDLQNTIATIRDEKADLKKIVMDLESQIQTHNMWEEEKKKYEKFEFCHLTFVYRLTGTPELFCNACFQKERVPIALINDDPGRTRGNFSCPNCHAKFPFYGNLKELLT